jgi:aerobactin synthase
VSARGDWAFVNQTLIAKAVGELAYEQVLRPEVAASPATEGQLAEFRLVLQRGVTYRFRAWRTTWDSLRVMPSSLERLGEGSLGPATCAGQFFIDCQPETGMTDIVLANFLEEMHSTLHADLVLLGKQRRYRLSELALWNGERLQAWLGGHPKILLNKGRLGMGASDLESFAPESARTFRLHWIALRAELACVGFARNVDAEALLAESLDAAELARFRVSAAARGVTPGRFVCLPVHPWQWDRVVRLQFGAELANGRMVSLGSFGDLYRPQISIRTLSNASRPERADVKLPLTILNTSAVRGISARYIPEGARLSERLADLCAQDEVLRAAGTEALVEHGGIAYVHPLYAQVEGAPYRYRETLAAIWRTSTQARLAGDEQAWLAASFFHQDLEGRALLTAVVARSGLSLEAWLRQYFEVVVVPLYHLQLRYGLGIVAHGQNVVVKLRGGRPCGMFLKDFQGDLRRTEDSSTPPAGGADWARHLDALPALHLLHDLLTGHFVTVLRFMSASLWESEGFAESRFYGVLGEVLRDYLAGPGAGVALVPDLDLRAEQIDRLLVNKVRFQIGYADSVARPLPQLGAALRNPVPRVPAEGLSP